MAACYQSSSRSATSRPAVTGEMFERQMLVTVEACEETDLKIALEFLPADHVARASGWPHCDGTPDLVAGLRKASAGLDAAALAMVATGTLARWFPDS